MPDYAYAEPCKLIVGLGNPGAEYEGTRHNAGFDAIDSLLKRMPKGFETSRRHSSRIWKGRFAGRQLALQKPETFMNLSGAAVASMARSEGVTPEQTLIVYDDMDLPLGRIRLRKGGGSGGHNGTASIIEALGTDSFPRLRIGIGKAETAKDGRDYVLAKFDSKESELYKKVLETAADAMILALRRGVTAAMDAFNPKDMADRPCDKDKKDNLDSNNTKTPTEVQR